MRTRVISRRLYRYHIILVLFLQLGRRTLLIHFFFPSSVGAHIPHHSQLAGIVKLNRHPRQKFHALFLLHLLNRLPSAISQLNAPVFHLHIKAFVAFVRSALRRVDVKSQLCVLSVLIPLLVLFRRLVDANRQTLATERVGVGEQRISLRRGGDRAFRRLCETTRSW